MINTNDDGHSAETCNYRACHAPAPKGPCPFVAESSHLPEALRVDLTPPHEHDWRQYWAKSSGHPPDGFYCTKCLTRTK